MSHENPKRISKKHAWVEGKLGILFGWDRITDTDLLVYFRLGDGNGTRGVTKFEAGFIWWFVYATWGDEYKERR